MQAYNVDADDDYEFHRSGPATGEYRGSGLGAYRGYNDSSAPTSSSRTTYPNSGISGGYSNHTSASGSRAGGLSGVYGGMSSGGGLNSSTNNNTNSSNNSGGSNGSHHHSNSAYTPHQQHQQHQHQQSRNSHPYSGGGGGGGTSDNPPHVGDARYAAAQAAVAAALGHTSISGSSAMSAAAHANAGYGNFAVYGNVRQGGSSSSSVSQHRGGGVGAGGTMSGPGGGPPRYNPSNNSDGGGGVSGNSPYHSGAAMITDQSSGSQPRPLARSSGGASHEYNPNRARSTTPVSTVLGGSYHNYAMPPSSMPLGGGGGSGGSGSGGGSTGGGVSEGHFVYRSISSGRADESRDVHGGRGGKRGRW